MFAAATADFVAVPVTVTLQYALYLPSAVINLISVVPGATAVTLPVWSTVATAVFLEDHTAPV